MSINTAITQNILHLGKANIGLNIDLLAPCPLPIKVAGEIKVSAVRFTCTFRSELLLRKGPTVKVSGAVKGGRGYMTFPPVSAGKGQGSPGDFEEIYIDRGYHQILPIL